MPVNLCWEDEQKTVIRCCFDGYWTWQDFDAAYTRITTMRQQAGTPIHMILDLSDTTYVPQSTLDYLQQFARNHIPKSGLNIIVSQHPLITRLFIMAKRLYFGMDASLQLVSTYDKAWASIDELRHMVNTIAQGNLASRELLLPEC